MKIQYLGTSAAEGWPGLFCNCEQCEIARILGRRNIRSRSQAVIFAEAVGQGEPDEILLLDFPPDTYMHCVQHGLRLDRLGHLLITHSHKDHFAPMDLICRSGAYNQPPPDFPLFVYGNEKVHQKFRDATAEWDNQRWPLGVSFVEVPEFTAFEAGVFTVTPLLAKHDQRERCLIYMVEYGGKRLLYAHDTNIFPEESFDFLAGKVFDLISLDCNFCEKSGGPNASHMGLPEILEVKSRLEKQGCLKNSTKIILNHFSHQNGTHYDAMAEVAKPHKLEVSYDGSVWDA